MITIRPEDKIAQADRTEKDLYKSLGDLNIESAGYADYINQNKQGLYDQTQANMADYNQQFKDFDYTGQLNQSTDDNLMQMYQNQISNINNYANEGVGGLMNQYANKGVLNSSATGKAMGDMGRNVQNLMNDANSNYMNEYMDAYNKQYDADFKNLLMEGQNLTNEYGLLESAYDSAYSKPASMWESTRNARYGNQADYIVGSGGSASDGTAQAIGTIASLAVMAFSDRRLKENITKVTEQDGTDCRIDGHQIYDWDWNAEGQKLTEQKQGRGVIAQEVQETRPDAIITDDPSGFLMVDYNKLFSEKE